MTVSLPHSPTHSGYAHVRVTVGLSPEAPSAARAAVRRLNGAVSPELGETLALVVSELVTNSVRHSGAALGAAIEVDLEAGPDVVRIEVADPGGALRAQGAPEAVGGWGLSLVEQLADRWRLDFSESTRVVCEFKRLRH